MKILADTSTFLAVALNEPEKPWLVEVTHGTELAAPAVLPYEIANALSAMAKRNRIVSGEAARAWEVARNIPVELVAVDVREAMQLAMEQEIYAYDAFFLHCAMKLNCPLLTLDRTMARVARAMAIKLMEKP